MITVDNQAIASRFVAFRSDYIKLDQTPLAKELGSSQRHISFIETGKALPNQKILTYLAKKYKLNTDWLMTGKGEPISNKKENPDSITNLKARISLLEKQVTGLQDTLDKILEKLK